MKTIIALAIAVLFAATTASAGVITKGGASGLWKSPEVKPGAPVAAMKCAACKSEFATVTTPTSKGSRPVTVTIERHACAACGTKWSTTGHGKAKVEVAAHTCNGCAM